MPDPIARRVLEARKALYYGTRGSLAAELDNADPSIVLYVNGNEVPRTDVVACNLSDDGTAWAHVPPAGKCAIDPVLGRIALAADLPAPQSVTVTYHYAFSADTGGGEYGRERRADAQGTPVLRVPNSHATIQSALAALGGDGVVEVTDSGRYEETLSVAVHAGGHVILRAAEQCQPTLILGGELAVTGGGDSAFTLEGLLVAGDRLRVTGGAGNRLARLRIAHATWVPGFALDGAGDPESPGAASLLIELPGVAVELERVILGALRVAEGASVSATDSVIDATAATLVAYCAPDDSSPGGALSLDACTVIGKINAASFGLVSNSVLLARAVVGDTLPPVHALRRQTGCVRFSYLPFSSLVPRRHRCQPESSEGKSHVAPRFTSLRYGVAAYCQLVRSTPDEIRRGADDESEMGVLPRALPSRSARPTWGSGSTSTCASDFEAGVLLRDLTARSET